MTFVSFPVLLLLLMFVVFVLQEGTDEGLGYNVQKLCPVSCLLTWEITQTIECCMS